MSWPIGLVGGCGWSQLWKGAADEHVPRPALSSEAELRRERVRASRARARAAGRCIVCRKNEPKPGCVTCVECLSASDERHERWVDEGRCQMCGRPRDGESIRLCREHATKVRVQRRNNAAARAAASNTNTGR